MNTFFNFDCNVDSLRVSEQSRIKWTSSQSPIMHFSNSFFWFLSSPLCTFAFRNLLVQHLDVTLHTFPSCALEYKPNRWLGCWTPSLKVLGSNPKCSQSTCSRPWAQCLTPTCAWMTQEMSSICFACFAFVSVFCTNVCVDNLQAASLVSHIGLKCLLMTKWS